MAGFLTALPFLVNIVKFVTKEASDWSRRRDTLKEAKLEANVAEIKAKAEIATYKVKADIEWDLAWAGQAETSWKDEWLLILWSVPMVVGMFSLFIPPLQTNVMNAIVFAQSIHPDMPLWYAGGWAVIFSATFGMKSLVQLFLPGKITKIADVFGELDDDIPDDVAAKAHERITNFLDNSR